MRKVLFAAMMVCTMMVTGCGVGKPAFALSGKRFTAATEAVKKEGEAKQDKKQEEERLTPATDEITPETGRTQLDKGVKLTWNCPNGDVIVTSVDTSGGRYKYYSDDGKRMIIENAAGKKVFGFVFTGTVGLQYADEAFRTGNEVLTMDGRLVTMHIKDKTPDYYQLVYQIPGSSSVLVLMTEHGDEVLNSAFCAVGIDVAAAPNGDMFTSGGQQDIVNPTEAYTPVPGKPVLTENTTYITFTVTAQVGNSLVLADYAGDTWYMDLPYGGAMYNVGDELEIVMDNTYGLDFDQHTITPIEIYCGGYRMYPAA